MVFIKKIKNMNNKMAMNTYLSTTESKKKDKQNRNRIIDTESILMVAIWEGGWKDGWKRRRDEEI